MKTAAVHLDSLRTDVLQPHVPDPNFRTIRFPCHGQDFLWLQIDQEGVVQECGPYQGWLWRGNFVVNHESLFIGGPVTIAPRVGKGEGSVRDLKYPILDILDVDTPLPVSQSVDPPPDILDEFAALLREERHDDPDEGPLLVLTYPDHQMNHFQTLVRLVPAPGRADAVRALWPKVRAAHPCVIDETEYLLDWWPDRDGTDGEAGLSHDVVLRLTAAVCFTLHPELPARRIANGWPS